MVIKRKTTMKKTKKTAKVKKATKKLAGIKPSKKALAKKAPAKKAPAKKAKKAPAKAAKPVLKPVVKRVADKKEVITACPVIDETGVVVMKSVDDNDAADDNHGVVMKPFIDNGVLTLVPDED
jgi:hypothetical protein